MVRTKVDKNIDCHGLHQHLEKHGSCDVDGWPITPSGDVIWLTNPYGIDVGFYPNDPRGCARILERVLTDTHDKEWGTL